MIRRSSTPDVLQTSLSIYQFKSALSRKSAPLAFTSFRRPCWCPNTRLGCQFPPRKWRRNTKWLKNGKIRKAILSAFNNISQRNFGILLILWCSFKLWWNFCLDQNFSYKGKGPLKNLTISERVFKNKLQDFIRENNSFLIKLLLRVYVFVGFFMEYYKCNNVQYMHDLLYFS
jgi:hypothetical protein